MNPPVAPSVRYGAIALFSVTLAFSQTVLDDDKPASAVYSLFRAPKLGARLDVNLRTYQSAPQPIAVRGYLSKAVMGHESTSGVAGMRGSESTYRRFVRFELSRLSAALRPARLEAVYTSKEGDEPMEHKESIDIPIQESAVVVDLGGVVDITGTRVENSGYMSSKFRNFNKSIVSGTVTVFDASGHILYHGAWPEPPATAPSGKAYPLPTPPRVFTNTAGRKIEARVLSLEGPTAVLDIAGRKVPVNIADLSVEDQVYLKELAEKLNAASSGSN